MVMSTGEGRGCPATQGPRSGEGLAKNRSIPAREVEYGEARQPPPAPGVKRALPGAGCPRHPGGIKAESPSNDLETRLNA